jgi:hypothetical protein
LASGRALAAGIADKTMTTAALIKMRELALLTSRLIG